jgi:putative SOS response-associated peptidase YedK
MSCCVLAQASTQSGRLEQPTPVPVGRPVLAHDATGPALADLVLLHQQPSGLTSHRGPHHFFPSNDFSISRSSVRSATTVLSRRFSSSRLFSLLAYVANGRSLINVRGERVGGGSGFREAFASRRCGVICDGFYEWNKSHEPTWFHRADGGLIVLGGLYQSAPETDPAPRFTILTTRPNALVAAVHDRMPLVVPADRIDDGLVDEATRVLDLIAPVPDNTLMATPVSTRVNSVRNDDPTCLLPVERSSEERQRSLF